MKNMHMIKLFVLKKSTAASVDLVIFVAGAPGGLPNLLWYN
jgi:hypothetical protein